MRVGSVKLPHPTLRTRAGNPQHSLNLVLDVDLDLDLDQEHQASNWR